MRLNTTTRFRLTSKVGLAQKQQPGTIWSRAKIQRIGFRGDASSMASNWHLTHSLLRRRMPSPRSVYGTDWDHAPRIAFCTPGWRAHAVDPAVWIGVLAVKLFCLP